MVSSRGSLHCSQFLWHHALEVVMSLSQSVLLVSVRASGSLLGRLVSDPPSLENTTLVRIDTHVVNVRPPTTALEPTLTFGSDWFEPKAFDLRS